jgi:hypothetical protein
VTFSRLKIISLRVSTSFSLVHPSQVQIKSLHVISISRRSKAFSGFISRSLIAQEEINRKA